MEEWEQELRRELPDGTDIFDAHVHLGTDIDGFRGDYDELERIQRRYEISRAFVFCLDEPDRHPAFRAANDRTLAYAERSGGRLIPFVRLDLAETPVEEATRCLDRGARGIKLHPRAQRFLLNDERLAPVFELAAERRVPILIHGGRGLPPIADHLFRLVDRYPAAQLIIAHGGIAHQPALEPTPPKGRATFEQPMALARVHQYLSMATPLLWTRQPDTIGVVGLALNACDERNGRVAELDHIKELLTTARDLWRALPEVEDERDRITTSRTTFRLIHLADILAV